MAETLTQCRVYVEITGLMVGDNGVQQPVRMVYEKVFSDGTGSNQGEQILYRENMNINATNTDLDLNGSSTWKDLNGDALAMVQMSVFCLINRDSDTGDTFSVTRPAAAGVTGMMAASDVTTVQPNGILLWVAPGPDKATTTGTTADLINLAAADNSYCDLFVLGDKT